MNFSSGRVAMASGGALVGLTLAETDSGLLGNSSVLPAASAGIVAAVVVAFVFRERAGSTTTYLGLVVLFLAMVSTFAEPFPGALGAGLVLGGLLVLAETDDRAWLQTALAAGVVAGTLAPTESIPRRYADYLSDGPDTSDFAAWALLVATGVTVAATSAFSTFGIPTKGAPSRGRTLAIGVGLPVVAVLAYWWFAQSPLPSAASEQWVAGGLLVACVVGAAVWSPRATGVILLAGLSLSVVDAGPYLMESPWQLLMSLGAVVVGSVLGRWRPIPVVGFGVLALSAVPAVFDAWIDPVLVLPAVASYLFASSVPSESAHLAVGLLGPLLVFVPYAETFGWTAYLAPAYTPLTSQITSDTAYDAQAVGAVLTILLCGAVAWMLVRRTPTIESP